jgi:fluoride exporter
MELARTASRLMAPTGEVGAFSFGDAMTPLYLIVGGSLGTLARYYVSGRVDDLAGPSGLGVFVVNIIACFAIGLFLTLSEDRFAWPAESRILVATGFLGAFSTFSTYTWETYQMLEIRNLAGASLNIVGSLACGLAAVYAGTALGRVV